MTPTLKEFIENSSYFRSNFPKHASVREFITPQIIFGLPILFYVFIYPPLLFFIWIVSLITTPFLAELPFFYSIFSDVTSVSEMSSTLYDTIMNVALLPLTVPYNIFTIVMPESLFSGIIELIVFGTIITAIIGFFYILARGIFALYFFLWRLF